MNKLILTFLFILFLYTIPKKGVTQKYLPIIDEHKEWSILNCPSICRTDNYQLFKDTVIGNTTYKLLDGFHFSGTVVAREDTVKQQFFLKTIGFSLLSPEILTYDFSLNVGDSMLITNTQAPIPQNSGYFKVDSIRYKDYLGIQRKTMYLSGNNPNKGKLNNAIWIEGIGSLSIINTPGSAPDVTGIGSINCVFKNGVLIYRNNYDRSDTCNSTYKPSLNPKDTLRTSINQYRLKKSLIFPNPASNYLTICGAKNNILMLYDNTGDLKLQINITSNRERIYIGTLNNGLYFYKIYDKKHTTYYSIGKLVVID